MFYLTSIISMLGYAFQGALMVSVYRKIDTLSAVTYRGLSFVISMSPLLLLVTKEETKTFFSSNEEYVLIASFLTLFANWFLTKAYLKIHPGISHTIFLSTAMIILGILSYYFLKDTLTYEEIAISSLIMLLIANLGIDKAKADKAKNQKIFSGMTFSLISGLLLGISLFIITFTSRNSSPWLTSIMWETQIGAFGILIIFIRYLILKIKPSIISFKYFMEILLRASPTLIGTGCYAYATTLGSSVIAGVIGSLSAIVMSFLCSLLYNDKLTKKEWIYLLIIISLASILQLL